MSSTARRTVSVGVVVTAAALLAACQGTDEAATPTADVPSTAAIGSMPDSLTDSPTLPPPPSPPSTTVETSATDSTAPDGTVAPLTGPFSERLVGDRLLFIGDGTLASAAPPADQQLCDALSVFGWEAEIDTFPGTDNLSYVSAVLDLRLRPDDGIDWDAVALWVGNEVPADGLGTEELADVLDATIERVAPRLVILYTLTETDEGRSDFNAIIRDAARRHPNVGVIDWAESSGPVDEVVELDGVTLASDGRKRLPLITASALGEAPADQDGGCLEPGVETDTTD